MLHDRRENLPEEHGRTGTVSGFFSRFDFEAASGGAVSDEVDLGVVLVEEDDGEVGGRVVRV